MFVFVYLCVCVGGVGCVCEESVMDYLAPKRPWV